MLLQTWPKVPSKAGLQTKMATSRLGTCVLVLVPKDPCLGEVVILAMEYRGFGRSADGGQGWVKTVGRDNFGRRSQILATDSLRK